MNPQPSLLPVCSIVVTRPGSSARHDKSPVCVSWLPRVSLNPSSSEGSFHFLLAWLTLQIAAEIHLFKVVWPDLPVRSKALINKLGHSILFLDGT